MPKSFGGIVGWVISAIVIVAVGTAIIYRVAFLRNIVYGAKAA